MQRQHLFMQVAVTATTFFVRGALVAGLLLFFVDNVQGRNCQSEYDSARTLCKGVVECYDACDKYDGYYACQDSCTARNRDCIEAANNQYEACVEGVNKQPLATQPNAQSVPALIDTAPKDDDLQPTNYFGKDAPPLDAQGRLQFVVRELSGQADMQLPDGTWVVVQEGSIIPYGATIFTGYDSKTTMEASNYLVIILRPLSELSVERFVKDASVYYTDLKLGTGELRFKIETGDYKTDMRVSTPVNTGAVVGTDVGVFYDKEKKISIWEVYDGTLEVTSAKTGERKTISSSYGSAISRLETTDNGVMIEKVAIPQLEWNTFVKSQTAGGAQGARGRASLWWVLLLGAVLGGGYVLYRKGLLYQFARIILHKKP